MLANQSTKKLSRKLTKSPPFFRVKSKTSLINIYRCDTRSEIKIKIKINPLKQMTFKKIDVIK